MIYNNNGNSIHIIRSSALKRRKNSQSKRGRKRRGRCARSPTGRPKSRKRRGNASRKLRRSARPWWSPAWVAGTASLMCFGSRITCASRSSETYFHLTSYQPVNIFVLLRHHSDGFRNDISSFTYAFYRPINASFGFLFDRTNIAFKNNSLTNRHRVVNAHLLRVYHGNSVIGV